MIWFAVLYIYLKQKNEEITNTNEPSITKSESKIEEKSFYEMGMIAVGSKDYKLAIEYLQKVQPSDTNYANAQKHIKNFQEYLETKNKNDKKNASKITMYKNKYEKLMKAGLYEYQIKERLQADRFIMIDSKYEKAPDGSKGIREYFSKYIDGITIDIWIQSAYSLSSYYTDVKVY